MISDGDLVDAERLVNRWDASVGNSDAMWDTLEAIGGRAGYRGADATFRDMMEVTRRGGDTTAIYQRPWRWLAAVARAAGARGDDLLPGRIFLFVHFFVNHVQPHMNVNLELENGLSKPDERLYQEMAAVALGCMAKLPTDLLIHDTATGRVDVVNAMRMASQVSGVPVPAPRESGWPATAPITNQPDS